MASHFSTRHSLLFPADAEGSGYCSSPRSSVSSIQFARHFGSDSESCISSFNDEDAESISIPWNDSNLVSPTTMTSSSTPSTLVSSPRAQFKFHQDKEMVVFSPNPDLSTIEEDTTSRRSSSRQTTISSVRTNLQVKVHTRRNTSETRAISASRAQVESWYADRGLSNDAKMLCPKKNCKFVGKGMHDLILHNRLHNLSDGSCNYIKDHLLRAVARGCCCSDDATMEP